MPDRAPVVLRRILALRQFPLFGEVDLDELATLAENVAESWFRAGAVVASPGRRMPAVHLVVDGAIAAAPPGHLLVSQLAGAGATWGSRHVFGALEVFAGREPASHAIATRDTHTLRLSAHDLGEVLEDNFGILVAVLRALGGRLAETGLPPRPPAPADTHPGETLGLVDRLILLRHQLPFARARLQALAILAHASTEITWPAGAAIARAGEPAVASYAIASGRVVDVDGLDAGDAPGLVEAIAGRPYAATLRAATPVRALASTASALYDMLEDNTDLGVDMVTTFAGVLLDRAAGSSGYVGPSSAISDT